MTDTTRNLGFLSSSEPPDWREIALILDKELTKVIDILVATHPTHPPGPLCDACNLLHELGRR